MRGEIARRWLVRKVRLIVGSVPDGGWMRWIQSRIYGRITMAPRAGKLRSNGAMGNPFKTDHANICEPSTVTGPVFLVSSNQEEPSKAHAPRKRVSMFQLGANWRWLGTKNNYFYSYSCSHHNRTASPQLQYFPVMCLGHGIAESEGVLTLSARAVGGELVLLVPAIG